MVDGLDAPDKQKTSDDVEIVQTRQSEKQKAREIFAKRYIYHYYFGIPLIC